uniref:Uncharacterized protein n=1 Tax=Panagrellus redivivus TaxID=6233 RepID=A0A7E4V995_PANRE
MCNKSEPAKPRSSSMVHIQRLPCRQLTKWDHAATLCMHQDPNNDIPNNRCKASSESKESRILGMRLGFENRG